MRDREESSDRLDAEGRIVPRVMFTDIANELAFWQEGHVTVDLLSAAALGELRGRFAALRPDDHFSPIAGPTPGYHCTFLDSALDYRREVDRLSDDLIAPLLANLLVDYEIVTSNIYVKPPGGGRLEVHLNWLTVADPTETTFTVWIPLTDATVEAGTLQVVPRSHKIFPDVATAAAAQYFSEFHNELIEQHLVPIEVSAGQAVVFDDTLIHWSDENTTDSPRAALQVVVAPTCAVKAIWTPDPADDRWLKVFEMDRSFWLTQDKSVFYGTPDLKCIGRVPNPNRVVSYEEFCDRLERSAAIRAATYSLSDVQ